MSKDEQQQLKDRVEIAIAFLKFLIALLICSSSLLATPRLLYAFENSGL